MAVHAKLRHRETVENEGRLEGWRTRPKETANVREAPRDLRGQVVRSTPVGAEPTNRVVAMLTRLITHQGRRRTRMPSHGRHRKTWPAVDPGNQDVRLFVSQRSMKTLDLADSEELGMFFGFRRFWAKKGWFLSSSSFVLGRLLVAKGFVSIDGFAPGKKCLHGEDDWGNELAPIGFTWETQFYHVEP
jgi:hypothetical protein